MAISGDVITQDGVQAKLHPYLVALARWCVSCLWSTATVLLHRLMTTPLPQITGSSAKPPKRPAGREHLHPEPRVECVVLHQPENHGLDVIFVHGLYGSLGNTWRQGEWRLKYHVGPEKTHLRRPTAAPSPCACPQCQTERNDNNNKPNKNNNKQNNFSESRINNYEDKMTIFEQDFDNTFNAYTNIDEKFYKDIKKILPQDEVFITEKFYNDSLLEQVEIIDNYETQAKFVSDLFKNCDNGCENVNNEKQMNRNENNNEVNRNNNEGNTNNDCSAEQCKCQKKCEMGCGCICDDCYSPCWPKDWIRVDFPNARVISINYTSDPHLWRPLWIKENKRLCLHERAEQMIEQLLALGVGEKPVVWVGHSKGGLFIKQIYCEGYEAYLKIRGADTEQDKQKDIENRPNNNENLKYNTSFITENINNDNENRFNNDQLNRDNNDYRNNSVYEDPTELKIERNSDSGNRLQSSNIKEDARKSLLWSNSIGLMLYSVPHRGSPLADIKTPLTARSVELMEISKDNALVLSLQRRWLAAAAAAAGARGAEPRGAGAPLVRSLVETRRTLMAVLWLRIVSEDSADPGIGALCGVSLDHREICKPSSRRCLLYTELRDLISAALNKYHEKI